METARKEWRLLCLSDHAHSRSDPSNLSSPPPSSSAPTPVVSPSALTLASAVDSHPSILVFDNTHPPSSSTLSDADSLTRYGKVVASPSLCSVSLLSLRGSLARSADAFTTSVNVCSLASDEEVMIASMSHLELGASVISIRDVKRKYWWRDGHVYHTR
jgi:hypothetical protein